MIIPLLTILVAIGLAAGSEQASSTAGAGESDAAAVAASDSAGGSTEAADAASEVGEKKPQIQLPKVAPPTQLEVRELVQGNGTAAKAGNEITVHYVLLLQKNGKEVASSWGGQPYSFELGGGSATAGWEQGIVGMQEGGRRELIAPANLAYGKAGIPPNIGPDEALVSVVDLIAVKPAPARGQAPSP